MTNAIEAEGLRRGYSGGFEAVRGISFTVPRGEIFALLGTNGAGKTSTVELLEGLAAPSAGTARVLGHDPYRERAAVRPRIGVMLQEGGFPNDLTVAETVRMWAGCTSNARPAAEALAATGLTGRERVRVKQLSGGERRRLDLALALLGRPEVLFLDEPTTGLDAEGRRDTWDLVRALRDGGTTVLLTTHYLEEAENCDRLGIIDHGRLVAQGTPLALKAAIGDDRVALRTGDDAAARQVVGRTAPPGLAVTLDTEGVSLRVPDGSAWIPRLCAALEAHGIAVHAASATPPTLDDVFFHHTGRSIHTPRPHPTPPAPAPDGTAAATEEAP